eukprot:10969103-Ditylum_brightwellii.AAC.1
MENNYMVKDDATNNINARLTSLEDFVGTDYEEGVRENSPNVSIAIKEILALLKEGSEMVENACQNITEHRKSLCALKGSTSLDKVQTIQAMQSM